MRAGGDARERAVFEKAAALNAFVAHDLVEGFHDGLSPVLFDRGPGLHRNS